MGENPLVPGIRGALWPLGDEKYQGGESMKSLVMVHATPSTFENGVFKVDRKFHVGMTAYAQEIRASLLTIHPQARDEAIMDPIEVPAADLPYRVMTVQIDRNRQPLAAEVSR